MNRQRTVTATIIVLVILLLISAVIINSFNTPPDNIAFGEISVNNIYAGTPVEITCSITHSKNIINYWYSTNNSGRWGNSSIFQVSDTLVNANYSQIWISSPVTVGVRVYATDSGGITQYVEKFFTLEMTGSVIAKNFDSQGAFWRSWQQKTFYAEGLFWAFYGNGSYELYSTSADGINWSPSRPADDTIINVGSQGCAIWYDGINTVYNILTNNGQANIYYKSGVLMDNGVVIWSDLKKIPTDTNVPCYPTIALTTTGDVWVSADMFNYNSGDSFPQVWRLNKNGAIFDGFPYQLTPTVAYETQFQTTLSPLAEGKMLVLYTSHTIAAVQVWDGLKWLAEAKVSTPFGGESTGTWNRGIVSYGDEAYVAYLQAVTNCIAVQKYTYSTNSFGPEQIISSSRVAYTVPMLSCDFNNGDIYCVWFEGDVNTAAYYSKIDTDLWSKPALFVNDTSSYWVSPYAASLSIQIYSNKLPLVYVEGVSSDNHPLAIKFVYIDIFN
jgi:hypothetical protein